MTTTTDINSAFTEAVIDTFEALFASPKLDDPAVVKPLDTTYEYLQAATTASAQVLFNVISRGSHDLIEASDHRMLISGTKPRELTCDTCGRLISHHGRGNDQSAYATLLSAVQDIEALAPLIATPDPRKK